MKHILKAWVVVVCFLAFVPAFAQVATEQEVREFLDTYDRAIARKDTAGIARFLSDDIEIFTTLTAGTGRWPGKLTKSQYLQRLGTAWPLVSNYAYKRRNEKIAISDEKVVVSADVIESMVVQGQYSSHRSKAMGTIERIDGVLLFTSLESQ